MVPLCGVPSVVAFLAYGVAGAALSLRMLKHGKDGPPSGLATFRSESYTPEGQRLLRILMRGWFFGMPLVGLLIAIAGGQLCRLTGWSEFAP